VSHARRARGLAGEAAAVAALEADGYTVLETNWVWGRWELDVVARDGDTLCFVEVKTVKGDDFGSPLEKVGPEKQRQVIRVAEVFRKRHRTADIPCRFDVVGVWLDAGDRVARTQIVRAAFEAQA